MTSADKSRDKTFEEWWNVNCDTTKFGEEFINSEQARQLWEAATSSKSFEEYYKTELIGDNEDIEPYEGYKAAHLKTWTAALSHRSVRLPERKVHNSRSVTQNMDTLAEYNRREGFNECLDEIECLNGKNEST